MISIAQTGYHATAICEERLSKYLSDEGNRIELVYTRFFAHFIADVDLYHLYA